MNQKLVVGCDLFLDLKLYRLPEQFLAKLKKNFPTVEVVPVNIKSGDPLRKDIEIYWGNRINPEDISALPRLKWIHFGSVGVNRAQTPEVIQRKIVVTNSRDVMTGAVAAHALALMTALARGLHHCERIRRTGDLTRESFDAHFEATHELEGETCLIVGFGQIGQRLAKICQAIGMNVETVTRTGKYTLDNLSLAVKDADYVINILPFTPQTKRVFNKDVFHSMKKSAFFINVGRGENVHEEALVEALKNKFIAGAGLDVFEKEPLSPSSELWNIPEVIITPHLGGMTNRYWEKECTLFEQNLERYMNGETLLNVVDMMKGY